MQPRKINYLPLLLLPLIIILIFALWSVEQSPLPWTRVDSDNAIFDARDIDFSKNIVSFNRCVEYIPGELLSPDEFDQRSDIQVGRVPDGTEVSTMRIRILVPDGIQYGIAGYSVNYASSVYINGKWLFDEGKPGLTAAEEESTEAYRVFSAEPHDGVIEILIQTSSFANIDTSSAMGWCIGEYEALRTYTTRKITIDIVVMAFYIILAVISLLLLLVLPKYKASGWLALLAVVWVIRTGLKNTKILLTLLPNHEWAFVYKVEIMTSFATIILLTLIIDSVFSRKLPRWLCAASIGGSALAIAYIIIMPWQTFLGHSRITNPIVYWALGILSFAALLSRRKEKYTQGHLNECIFDAGKYTLAQIVHLAGVALVLFAFIWDQGYFQYELFPWSLTQPMMLVFTMFMMVAAMLATMRKTVEQEVLLTQTVEKQEQELSEARISMMLSQIQPHFLYNSLSAIGKLCYDKPDAYKALITFSEYLRANMDSLAEPDLIPFAKELEHTQQYLYLEQLRFEERLSVEYDIQTEDFSLPALTLQPIVENAVKHGVTKRRSGGTVVIHTEETRQGYRVTVADDGVGFDPSAPNQGERSHTGVSNVRARLASMCGGSLEITSTPGDGTKAIIDIPKGGAAP